MQEKYNLRKVDKVNLITVLCLVSIICVQVVIAEGFKEAMEPIIGGGSIILVMLVSYFLPINNYLRGQIYAGLAAIVITGLIFTDGYNINKHYMMIITIAMVTLYFKKEMILIHGILFNVCYILLYLFVPENLLSTDTGLKSIITVITVIDGMLILLYFLTKWGNDLVKISVAKEEEATKLLNQLSGTFQTVGEGTTSLDNNIEVINSQVTGIKQASQGILESVQQIAAAIQEEASSVNLINETMNDSLQGVNHTVIISRGVMDKSNDISIKVEDGWKKIKKITKRMGIVHSAISVTAGTVNELKVSLDRITNLLDGIKDIAGQTNLLALNASIESARAGEHGKGFAVVADQIRKLSEQSKEIVADITKLTESILSQSEEASIKSIEGEKAATDGLTYINEIADYFDEIKESYHLTNNELQKSLAEIETTAKNFIEIQGQITNVASISEENSAATEEILSYIEDENSQISSMNDTVNQIHDLSGNLKEMLQSY